VHIITDPLLDEGREECGRKTENEGHKPKRIHTDIGCGWIESRERGRRGGRDGELWGYERNLLRDLGEDSDVLLEIVYHLVRWVRFQVLFTVDDKRGESSRKQTSLCTAHQHYGPMAWMDKMWTDKYENAIHIILQSLNPRLIAALGFCPIKRPECVGTTVEIAYHALFLGLSVRAVAASNAVDRWWVVDHCLF